ncbi:unnamed protein product (macronuclear) [Paramecium tetraurelia]|uniref:Uncharacterized protein n=1 Tax=Paramecium tetraurelia TaxID=5888 RepID=A0DPI2_PARTE|nr:uncharacterized protein GSPATT00019131001 [Paramecium tetraurelia]CAK84949.1 unnamed protein product [Paramecium tetraurelia]|eukprot:XP_001452346.1 hypothetical protein (macronuclear) [Paramecium tetraurelia strain d4-2]
MQQNSSFDENVQMEIENQVEQRVESQELAENQRFNEFQTPPKQDHSQLENEINNCQESPHFTCQLKKNRQPTDEKYNSENEDGTFQKKDEFQINMHLLNNLIIQAQERLQNQSQLSLCTIDLSLCNETYSEIKQQLFEIEKVYRSKDDELSQLNIQLEKEFNACKNQKNLDQTTNSQLNQSFDIIKRYQQLQEIKKNKLIKFKKNYREKYNQLRKELQDLKSIVEQMFSKNPFFLEEEEQISEFCKVFNQRYKFIEEISFMDNSNSVLDDQKQESPQLKEDENLDSFILTLMKQFNINQGDVDQIKSQIVECVKNQKELIEQQKLQLEIIQTNQNLSANQQIHKLKTKKDELENELIQLNQLKESQQKALDQTRKEVQELKQQLELTQKIDYVFLNSKLFQFESTQMKQQQKLVQITQIIFQQLMQSTAFKSQIKEVLNEQTQYLNSYCCKANEIINKQSWQQDEDPLKYLNYHQQTISKMVDTICIEYSKMIKQIQQQREELMSQL